MTEEDALLVRHAQRLGVPLSALVSALLQYARQKLADWTEEGDDDTIAGEKNDPGSVWCVGDAPEWLEPHMPEEWRERHRNSSL